MQAHQCSTCTCIHVHVCNLATRYTCTCIHVASWLDGTSTLYNSQCTTSSIRVCMLCVYDVCMCARACVRAWSAMRRFAQKPARPIAHRPLSSRLLLFCKISSAKAQLYTFVFPAQTHPFLYCTCAVATNVSGAGFKRSKYEIRF